MQPESAGVTAAAVTDNEPGAALMKRPSTDAGPAVRAIAGAANGPGGTATPAPQRGG